MPDREQKNQAQENLGSDEQRQQELKKLNSEQYFNDLESIKDTLKQFREFLNDFQSAETNKMKNYERLKEAVKGSASNLEPELNSPQEIVKKIEDRREIRVADEERLMRLLDEIKNHGKKYNLNYYIDPTVMSPEQIIREIEKAYVYRKYEIKSRFDSDKKGFDSHFNPDL